MTKLLGYDYEITYKSGKDNNAADALSRVPGSPQLNALFAAHTPLWNSIKTEASTHPYMLQIKDKALANLGAPYNWRNGLVHYKNRVVIPPQSTIIPQLMHEFHDSHTGGHSGVLHTYKRLASQFYWPSMYSTVHNYVALCDVCQRNKQVENELRLPSAN